MKDKVDMLVRIDSVDQLFNSPSIDPFSDKPAIILGEAALMYAVHEHMGEGFRKWYVSRMVIQLPGDKITPGLEAQVAAAVRRYALFKHAENQILINSSRWRSFVRLIMAIAFVVVILLITQALGKTLLASAPSTVTDILTGLLTIIIWATIWGPWDSLLYGWLEPALENFILRRIATMEILLQPEPQPTHVEMPHPWQSDSQEMPDQSQPGKTL